MLSMGKGTALGFLVLTTWTRLRAQYDTCGDPPSCKGANDGGVHR